MPILLTVFVGIVDLPGQNALEFSTNNSSPIEGCDEVTFSVKVCNLESYARPAIVKVHQMQYFEVTDWGDFDVGSPGDPTVDKDLGNLAGNHCEELEFKAMALSSFTSSPNNIEAKVTFSSPSENFSRYATVLSQGYNVLDGRGTPLLLSDAIDQLLMPTPGQSCGFYPPQKFTVLGTLIVDVGEDYCVGLNSYADVRMGGGAEMRIEAASNLMIRGDI